MRPAVVLFILATGLLATVLLRPEPKSGFDTRYERAEEKIRALGEDIDKDLNKPSQTGS